jgi:hypothetical protein
MERGGTLGHSREPPAYLPTDLPTDPASAGRLPSRSFVIDYSASTRMVGLTSIGKFTEFAMKHRA